MLQISFFTPSVRPIVASTFLMLTACSSISSLPGAAPDEEYIGWHCEGDVESTDNWNCSEQLMKGGVLVSQNQAQASANAKTSSVNSESNEPSDDYSEFESDKTIKADQAKTVVESSTASDENTLVENTLVENTLVKNTPVFEISGNGYTVQLGAYLSQPMAEAAADKIVLSQGALRVRDIIVDERYLFVVVYGQFQQSKQAKAAAEQLAELNPGLNYWVRSIASMRDRE